MAHPCAGKTTFAERCGGEYRGVAIYDFDEPAQYGLWKWTPDDLFGFEPPACLLYNAYKPDINGVACAAVLVPLCRFKKNVKARRALSLTAVYSQPKLLAQSRVSFRKFVKRKQMPVFDSFALALDALIEGKVR